MKVDSDDNRIRVRKEEGVVLVLDRDDGISFELYRIVKDQERELGIPFKLGALSYKEELTKEGIEGLNQRIQNRGRFIAPLMEGFFQQLPDKGYDLIILHSGCIYDIEDFSRELTVKFNKVIIKDINDEKYKNLTLEQWGEIFKNEVFNFSIGNIALYFLSSAVPYEWRDDFTLSPDMAQKRFVLTKITKEGVRRIDTELKTRGKSDIVDIEIEVNGSRFKKTLKNDKMFTAPQWRLLSKDEIEIFNKHIEGYKRSDFVIYCSRCSKEHEFKKPFFCDKSKDEWKLLSEGRVIFESMSEHQSKLILFQKEDNVIKFLSTEKEILEFEDMRFVFVSKSSMSSMQVYEVRCEDISLEIKESVKIYNNLYELEKGKSYVWCV